MTVFVFLLRPYFIFFLKNSLNKNFSDFFRERLKSVVCDRMVGCVGKAVRWLAEKFLDLNLANRWSRGDDFLVIKGLVSWFFGKLKEFWVIYEIILYLLTKTYAVYFVKEAFSMSSILNLDELVKFDEWKKLTLFLIVSNKRYIHSSSTMTTLWVIKLKIEFFIYFTTFLFFILYFEYIKQVS